MPKDVALTMNLLVARMLLREKKYGEAEQKLKGVAAGMKPDDPQRAYVAVYLASTQVAQGHLKEAEQPLEGRDQGRRPTTTSRRWRTTRWATTTSRTSSRRRRSGTTCAWTCCTARTARSTPGRCTTSGNSSIRCAADQQRSNECLDKLKAMTGTEYAARAEKETAADKKTP